MSLQEFNDRMHKLAEDGKLQCPCGNNGWEEFIFAGFGGWAEATCKRCDSLFRISGKEKRWKQQLFTVCMYNCTDKGWIEVSDPLPREQAKQVWLQKAKNGTDCYIIFPLPRGLPATGFEIAGLMESDHD